MCGKEFEYKNRERLCFACRIKSDPARYLRGVKHVPSLYQQALISDFDFPIPCVTASGIFISGPVGTGKTHLATAILAEYLPHLYCRGVGGYDARWVSVPRILSEVRGSFSERRSNAEDVLDCYIATHMLVLDDLGAERSTPWAIETLYLLLSDRANYMRPTIVTSNLRPVDFDVLDSRLSSRLASMVQMELTGKDRRIKDK